MLCRVRKGGDNVCIRKTSTKLIRTPLVPRWPKSTMRICACAYEEWEIDTSLRRTGADSDGCGVRSCPWLQDWPKNRSSRKLALSGGSRLWLVVVEVLGPPGPLSVPASASAVQSAEELGPLFVLRRVESLFSLRPGPSSGVYGYSIKSCLLYTSPSPRDGLLSRMPSSA